MSREERQQYWPLPINNINHGFAFELRTSLAWDIVKHFAIVAAKDAGEDGAKRAKLELQNPEYLVSRAYSIADNFVNVAENRQGIKAFSTSDEEAMAYLGKLEHVKSQAAFPINDMPRVEPSPQEREMVRRHRKELAELRVKEAEQETKGNK